MSIVAVLFAGLFGHLLGKRRLDCLVVAGLAPLDWGIILNGLLFLPLVLIATLRPLGNIPADPAKPGRPWRDIRDIFVTNRQMRTVAIVACALVIFVAPVNTLLVPITEDLRQAPLLAAAGLLSATIGLGRCFSAALVDRLSRGRTELTVSVLADVGAANDAAAAHHPAQALAALFLASALVAPLGLMMWGILIDSTSTTAAVTVAAIGIIAAFTYSRSARPLSPGTD